MDHSTSRVVLATAATESALALATADAAADCKLELVASLDSCRMEFDGLERPIVVVAAAVERMDLVGITHNISCIGSCCVPSRKKSKYTGDR